jgi:DHA2 family multidrug resistance protein
MNPYNPEYIQRRAALIAGFLSKGFTLDRATQMTNAAMEGIVDRQTMLVTYDNLYLTIGVFVLCCIPIVFLQPFKRNVAIASGGH